MIGRSLSHSSASTTQQNRADANPQKQTVPPPKFEVYKYLADGVSPTSVVVPVNTTDEQLKTLLRLFREKVRSHELTDIGLENEADGIIDVYRGKKCANEDYVVKVGPCGKGDHTAALYQWGIEHDPNKDSGSIQENGKYTVVFNYDDGSETR